ncbi:PKD domain-containing protein [bacterium]|nr:PKD domain-containing protein [bacterium]
MHQTIKKLVAISALFFYLAPFSVFAQDQPAVESIKPEEVTFTPAITASSSVQINKNIIFDASGTKHPDENANITYTWDFGDGNKKEGREVVYSYTTLGQKTLTLTANDGKETKTVTKDIFVYKKIIIFITDKAEIKDRVEGFKNYARDRDTDIVVYESYDSATEFITEEILERKLREATDNLKKIDEIIVWTEGNSGLNALSRVKQNQANQDDTLTFENKTILVINNDDTPTQLARQYELLKPKNIVSAKEPAIYAFIESATTNEFINRMEKNGYDYELTNAQTGQLQLWNFMSYFVNYLIDSGIPANTVILILMLPVIATVVSIMKQVVGVTTFGVYTPTIITLTFWILGLKFGLLTLLVIFLVGTGTRIALKRYRLLYVPRMAIVLTSVAVAILFMLILSIRFNLFDSQFYSLSVFPMLILSTLTEKFVSAQGGKSFKQTMIATLQTVLVAIIAYIVIGGDVFGFKINQLQGFMLAYPEVIILIIFFNVFLGRWPGLKLLEYARFREVLRHVEEE